MDLADHQNSIGYSGYLSELVYPDLPIEEQTSADSAVRNIDESNIDDSSVSNGFEGNQTALDLVGGASGGGSQDSGVKYQANSPIYKSPIYGTCIGHSDHQSNEETSWNTRTMNYDGNSQSSKIQSVNVHDRDTTLDMNTNFRSNTDLGYAGINRQFFKKSH